MSAAASAADITPSVDKIFQQWNKPDAPGCAVAYSRAGEQPVSRYYGSADLEHNLPIDADTVFEAGSVSKQFVAASILRLVEQGKLALLDDVRKYLPELADYGTKITIDHLLNHTSGLRDWGEVEAIAGWPRGTRVYTLPDVLDIAARQKKLNYTPGSAYSYTNTGYTLLAIIVQRVSGESLAEFSRKQFFMPLNMSHTQWRDNFRRVVKHRAIAYRALPKGVGYEQEMPFESAYGNGGMITTVGDLLLWNDALDNGKLGAFITAELQRQSTLTNGKQISYARGLIVESHRGVREIAHSGSTAAYRAWLGRYPTAHVSIALLCNAGDANNTDLAHAVADLLLPSSSKLGSLTTKAEQLAKRTGRFVSNSVKGDSLKARFKPWHPTALDFQKIVGSYSSDEALATYKITMQGAELIATPGDRKSIVITLEPTQVDTFQMVNGEIDGVLRFKRNAKGEIESFEVATTRVFALPFRRDGLVQ